MSDFLQTLLSAIFGKPDATRIGRTIRGFGAAVLSSLIYGLVDWAGQLYAGIQAGGPIIIDWHLIQRTVLITLFPTLIGWAIGLALYLRKIAEEARPEGVIYSESSTRTTPTTTTQIEKTLTVVKNEPPQS